MPICECPLCVLDISEFASSYEKTNTQKFSLEQVKSLLVGGICAKKRNTQYLGFPGAEMSLCVDSVTEEELDQLIPAIVDKLPLQPVKPDTTNIKSFWRILFKCPKRGVLYHNSDIIAWIINRNNLWERQFRLCSGVCERLLEKGDFFNHSIVESMIAHRHGDIAVAVDAGFTDSMIEHYQKSIDSSLKCCFYKVAVNSCYYCACYLERLNDHRTLEWANKYLEFSKKHPIKHREKQAEHVNKILEANHFVE